MITVVALGGNALTRPGQRGTAAEQLANLHDAAAAPHLFATEARIVVTHGNGPQVGNELLRHERAADEVPPCPVGRRGSDAGGDRRADRGGARPGRRPASCLRAPYVVVSEDDPAFGNPAKPIGPFYSAEQAHGLEEERGWQLVHDAGRGYRRVVPSPQPLRVVELSAVRSVDAGTCAVACGGGGIPVARVDGRLAESTPSSTRIGPQRCSPCRSTPAGC